MMDHLEVITRTEYYLIAVEATVNQIFDLYISKSTLDGVWYLVVVGSSETKLASINLFQKSWHLTSLTKNPLTDMYI